MWRQAALWRRALKTRKRRQVSEGKREELGSNQKKQRNPEAGAETAGTLPVVARPQKKLSL